MAMKFRRAQRKYGKLRAAIGSPSGAGKTTQALLLALGLVGPSGRIAVIDTERESADLYAGDVGPKSLPIEFDTLPLSAPYTPERYIEAINAAEAEKYDVLIIDSMTHEWNGIGGVLELVDKVASTKTRGNTWAAWNELTPRHRKFVDAILAFPGHVICTIRSKTETDQVEDEKTGRKKVIKLGMKNEQRDGTDYEFTLVFEIDHDTHYARATKDRTKLFPDPVMIDDDTVGKRIRAWLDSGAKPTTDTREDPNLLAIERALSILELKNAFSVAWKEARGLGDEGRAAGYKVAYDRALSALTETQEQGGTLPPSELGDGSGPNDYPDPNPDDAGEIHP